MSWINEILEQHSEFESPKSFWYWSALTAISAVVKDNVWIDRYLFKQYPNIYVLLYAESGLKKGPPINMAKQLVSEVNNTRIISGRSSIQGILRELGTTETKPGGTIDTKASGFICASELSASIVEDQAALNILTDLFDRSWNSIPYTSLLKMEKFDLKDPTITLIGGINPAHADAMFTNKDIKGGFLGRSFVIHESKRNKVNSLIDPPKVLPDYKKSAEYLKVLSKLKGEFAPLTKTKAGQLFGDWYSGFVKAVEEQKIEDSTGTLNRFSESVMKVAMLISLAGSTELVITEESMAEAIAQSEKLIGNIRKTTLGQGKSVWAQEKALLIMELVNRENHMITRQQLNKKYMMRASANEWDEIAASLEVAGAMSIERHGSNIVYKMDDANVEGWKRHLKGQ